LPTNSLKQILLVEDNPHDAELTLLMLSKCGLAIKVDRVCDGAEALDYLYRRAAYAGRIEPNPVVVLLDLKMPKVNGLEVLREIKSDQNLQSMPVVIFTSSREPRDLQECYRLGANGYVVKPVDGEQFTQAIKNLGAFWAATNELPPG
jgi:CheY-like chemotaxis protein